MEGLLEEIINENFQNLWKELEKMKLIEPLIVSVQKDLLQGIFYENCQN